MPIVIASIHGQVSEAALRAYANDQHGPIRRDLARRGQRVLEAADKGCPVRTGKLRSTGRKADGLDGDKPCVDITFGKEGETDYLGDILYGTPAHEITAHDDRPNAHLRFVVGGQIVFAKMVHHPGTKANNFLERALPAAAG